MHCDTHDMPCNRLTKFDGQDYALLHLMDTGYILFKCAMKLRIAPSKRWIHYDENDLHGSEAQLNSMDWKVV